MKIIQSYAHFDEGTPRLDGIDDKNKIYLSFYSFLLSFLTLKKYYNNITMYCNKNAQKKLIKYIPYDKVNIVENKNSSLFWSYYKIDIIKLMTNDFIHVDSDVFIFDDLFSKFIQSKQYDILIQNKIPKDANYVRDYADQYKKFLIKSNIFDPTSYDGECLSCGTIGMRIGFKDGYINVCEAMKNEFINNNTTNNLYIGMACEELALYFYAIKNKLKTYEILSHENILKHGERGAGNLHKYTHMYFNSKFKVEYVKLIRNKIYKEFPNYINYVEKYESDVMKNFDFFKQIC